MYQLYVHLLVISRMRFFLAVTTLLFLICKSGHTKDDFSWLKESKKETESIAIYLKNKNELSSRFLFNLKPLQETLIKEWEESAPNKPEKPWLIRGKFELSLIRLNNERVIAIRDRKTKAQKVLFNIEYRSSQHDYYQLGGWSLSPNGKLIALAEDILGTEEYRIVVINLENHKENVISDRSEPTLIWTKNNQSLYTIKKTESDFRPFALYLTNVDTGVSKKKIEEEKVEFLLSVYSASDDRYAIVQSNNETMTEQRILNLESGSISEPIRQRKSGIEYTTDIANELLYIQSNISGKSALYYQELLKSDKWQELYSPEEGTTLQSFHLFSAGILIREKNSQQESIVILPYKEGKFIRFPLAPKGSVGWLSHVGDFNSNIAYIRSMSLVQPAKWEMLDIAHARRSVISEDTYPNYHVSDYQTETIFVPSGDVKIPVTLAYKKSMFDKNSPVVLYVYGAYGFKMKPYFMPQITSMLDQGIVYAIAHVRGGGYYGEKWHQAGKGVNKPKGISDFLSVVKAMKNFNEGNRKIAAMGSSAGAVLIAAAVNRHPEYFSAINLNVPFVDVVSSMANSKLPLTAQQYYEWGNPHVQEELSIMSSFDPMRNIHSANYPPTLVRIGWHDSRVPYWEGAQYLSLISQKSKGRGPYLLLTDFESGHSVDQRKALTQQAMDYAFLIHFLSLPEITEL